MTGDLIRQDNTFIGAGAPVTGDEITNNTALCGLNTFYIDKTNGASYVRTAVNKVTGDWTQIGGGGGIESVVAGSGIAVDDTDPANPVVSATGGALLSATVELTDAQIKALPTTPIQIIAAPGEGKIINVINAFFSLNIPVAYNESYDLEGLYYEDVLSPSSSNTLGKNNFDLTDNTNQFTIAYANVNAKYQDIAINSPVIYRADRVADFTGGDAANTLKVTVYYVVVDL